jgi:acyl-CoA thioester hydrolase
MGDAPKHRPDAAPLAAWGVPHPSPHLLEVEVDAASLSACVPHLNNVEILRLVDRAAESHLDGLGHTRASMAARGVMWFVVRHEIDYLAEAFGGDRLLVATWIRRHGRTTSDRVTRIVRPGDGTIVAAAESRWVHIDLATRRPLRIPKDLLAALPIEPDTVAVPLA